MLDPAKEAHAHADRRLRAEPVAWLSTVRADGQAQSTPVWFLWDGDTFLVYSQPGAQKVRNLTANPKVSLHLSDDGAGGDVVSFEGAAAVEPDTPRPDREELSRICYTSGSPPGNTGSTSHMSGAVPSGRWVDCPAPGEGSSATRTLRPGGMDRASPGRTPGLRW